MSEYHHRREGIIQRLNQCQERGILRDWYCQGDMPGIRWNLEGGAGAIFTSRSYTTSQVEDFLVGALSGYYVGKESA